MIIVRQLRLVRGGLLCERSKASTKKQSRMCEFHWKHFACLVMLVTQQSCWIVSTFWLIVHSEIDASKPRLEGL